MFIGIAISMNTARRRLVTVVTPPSDEQLLDEDGVDLIDEDGTLLVDG